MAVLAFLAATFTVAAPAQAVAPAKTYPACSAGAKSDLATTKIIVADTLAYFGGLLQAAKDAWYADKQNQALKSAYYAERTSYRQLKIDERAWYNAQKDLIKVAKGECNANGGTYLPVRR
jgi:hypothetical protein